MNKPCIPALILALAPMVAAAQGSVTVYGRLDVSVDRTKTGDKAITQLRDNASRLGFRGVEDLGGGLQASFGLEAGLSPDTGTPTTPFYRNSYVALHGGFGVVALGRLDSANPTRSPVYSLITRNTDFVIHDAGATAVGTRIHNARNRTSNSLGYITPAFGGLTFMARYYLNGFDVANVAESDIKQLDLGLEYKRGGLGVGVGFSKDKVAGGLKTNNFSRKLMAVAGYDFGFIRPYASYGRDEYMPSATSRKEVDYWLLGVSSKFGNSRVVVNYMERDVQSDRKGTLKKFQAGYAYALSKRTSLFALVDRDDPNSNRANDVIRNVSAGIQHNF